MNIQGFAPAMPAAVEQPSSLKASALSNSGSSSSASSSSSTSSSSLQTTFLNLLITELQNQDPTSPVDPTEMVGQMISLNQLDQLISINQTLDGLSSSGSITSGTESASTASQSNVSTHAIANQSTAKNLTTLPVSAAAAAANALPALGVYAGATGNASLMNLYSSLGLPTVNPYPAYTGAK